MHHMNYSLFPATYFYNRVLVDYIMSAYGEAHSRLCSTRKGGCPDWQKLILNLCLSDGFDMFPSLLVTDGSCMIDRRMGIHGHPLEIQVS